MDRGRREGTASASPETSAPALGHPSPRGVARGQSHAPNDAVATLFQAGSIVAGCRLDREVGSGGMGVVWQARDLTLERPVALKLIRPDLAADRGFRERFTREARLAASLDHAHVLPVYEVGRGRRRAVLGHALRRRLRPCHAARRRTPPRAWSASRLLAQVALALDAAHAAGLVHRDVKPANILIASQDGDEHAYLSDFGLTIEVAAEDRLTAAGLFVGTRELRGTRAAARRARRMLAPTSTPSAACCTSV